MNFQQVVPQALALAFGGSISVLVAYYLIKDDLHDYLESKKVKSVDDKSTLLSLRLQAHERMVLFIERINPVNVLVRIHQKGIEVGALQTLVVNEINAEYQHNITQQLYIDVKTWAVISKLKDDTVAMINNAVKNLPADASGIDLSKKVLQHMSQIEENPYDLTIVMLKQSIQKMF